jgi:hypothetical protein
MAVPRLEALAVALSWVVCGAEDRLRSELSPDDGAVIMVEWHGYGRSYPPGRRQIVGAVFHLADREPYRRLNDVVCVCVGEVRASSDPGQPGPDLVIDVAELVWEPIAL